MKKLYLALLGLLCIQGLFLSRYVSTIGSEKEMQSRYVVLEALYPTDKVEDLFKKFPKGFSVVNMRHYQNRKLLVEVKGDPATGQVTGVIIQEPIVKTGENDPEEYKSSIYFDNGKMKMCLTSLRTFISYSKPSISANLFLITQLSMLRRRIEP